MPLKSEKEGEQLKEGFKNAVEQLGTKVTTLEVCVASLEEAESSHTNVTTTLQQEVNPAETRCCSFVIEEQGFGSEVSTI